MPVREQQQKVLKAVGPTKSQRVRGGRGVTVEAVPNHQIRFKYIPHPSDPVLRHQWNQTVRRSTHHAAAHAAGVHDGDGNQRINCRRCKVIVPVYPQSLSDYGYNNNLVPQKDPTRLVVPL